MCLSKTPFSHRVETRDQNKPRQAGRLGGRQDRGAAYKGPCIHYGTQNDAVAGLKTGGVNVCGGGLALYDSEHHIAGAAGAGGGTACADHNIAWRTRHHLNLSIIREPPSPAPPVCSMAVRHGRTTSSSTSPRIRLAARETAPRGSATPCA
jgi:hypothetical protein